MQEKRIKPYLALICFLILTFFITFYLTKKFFSPVPTTNIVDNKLIDWGMGWKNNQSFYSGSELGFKFKNSRKISFEFTTASKADQGAEVLIDNDKYFINLPNLSKQQLSINVNKNEPHTVRIRHFCTFLYYSCDITLANVYLDNNSELMPYKSNKKVLSILGDSISTIYGKDNYSFLLADELGYELHDASVLGSTVSKVKGFDNALERFEKDLRHFRSDITIVFLGINDVANNVPLGVFENDYSTMIKKIKKWNPQSKVFLVGILPTEDINFQAINTYNEIIKMLTRTYNVSFVDVSHLLNKNDFSDAIHPSIEAQKKLSEKFLEAISARMK